MRKTLETEIKVGLFVTIGTALIMLAILVLGSTENIASKKNRYYIHLETAEGIIQGAKVTLGGIRVGTVDNVEFDGEKRDIKVTVSVARQDSQWIRKNSVAEIATQGMLGDKYIAIKSGNMDEPALADSSDIPVFTGRDLNQFLNKGDQLMVSLNSIAKSLDHVLKNFESQNRSEVFFQGMATTAKNLSLASEKLNREIENLQFKKSTQHLEQILGKINNGTGTLGALVNDPGLYDDVKALMGGANRNKIVRNLVRQTIRKNEEAENPAPQKK